MLIIRSDRFIKNISFIFLLFCFITVGALYFFHTLVAQTVESTNYRLINPSNDSISGISTSTNFNLLNNSNPVSGYNVASSNFSMSGGTAKSIEAIVPSVLCAETNTDDEAGGITNTSCTSNMFTAATGGADTIQGDGTNGVCGLGGCYNRARVEIDPQGNPSDVRYAIQISTDIAFVTNVFYISPITRTLKANLAVSDFVYKCEWEGNIDGVYCPAANTTWQKTNILGLAQGTQYYVRFSALKGSDVDGSFTQSAWGPSANFTTQNSTISFDIDIADNVSTVTAAPHIIDITNILPTVVRTSTNMIVFKLSTNANTGMQLMARSTNGFLQSQINANQIPFLTGDLDAAVDGIGLRNTAASNTSRNLSAQLGSITVSSNFQEILPANRVGGLTTNYTKLFDSNSLPLYNGTSGYFIKVKAREANTSGLYTDTFNFVPLGIF